MTQKYSVDMSQYREQQQLLSSRSSQQIQRNEPITSSEGLQHSISESIPNIQQPSQPDDNQNHNNLGASVVGDHHNNEPDEQAQNPANPVNININPPVQLRDPYRIFRVLLDYAILLTFISKFIYAGKPSTFAMLWVGAYFIHIFTMRPCRQIKRNFVASVFVGLVIIWAFWGSSSINIDMRIFMLAYLIQVIPFILGCMCACCIASCTCACATCCLCWYAFASTRASIFGCVEKVRFRKLKEQLCNQQLTTVDDRQCPICLEVGEDMNTLNCHHSFHPKCLSAWIDAHKTCPVCRAILY